MDSSKESNRRLTVFLLHLVVFLGAFLLFSMEPLTGRLLTPFFGGTVHIWLVCLMSFQFLLLLGYLYAHLLAKKAGRWHLALLFVPLINLPLQMASALIPEVTVLNLLSALTRHIALPFTVLSTTVVVVQLWVSRSSLSGSFNPYVLYGTSNAGSLLALLGYPLLVEPFTGLRVQSAIWSGGYLIYLFAAAAVWYLLRPCLLQSDGRQGNPGHDQPEQLQPLLNRPGEQLPPGATCNSDAPGRSPSINYAYWALLSCLSSALLVTVTNLIAMEIGSFPLVWVLPLALYLASFIITFRDGDRLSGNLMYLWPEIIILGLLLYVLPANHWLFHVLQLLVLLAVCIMIHGDLYRRRPTVERLTGFYLAVALGGFLGGAAITLGAPILFPGLYEFPIVLSILAILFCWKYREFVVHSWSKKAIIVLFSRLGAAAVLYGILITLSGINFAGVKKAAHRNYYGVSRIMDYGPDAEAPAGVRFLIHGSTIHGLQFLDKPRQKIATTYYHVKSGLGDAFTIMKPPRRIAAVGLGAGTAGMHTLPEDVLDYYEIDPDMETLARRWFTFMEDTRARTRVIVGDGRLNLQKSREQYDLVFVDAFSGDGIPTHLITREALEIYLTRLGNDGILLFHLTNRHYDLRPVLKSSLSALGIHGAMKRSVIGDKETYLPITTIYLVAARKKELIDPFLKRGWTLLGKEDGLPPCKLWTDDYINILAPAYAKWLAK